MYKVNLFIFILIVSNLKLGFAKGESAKKLRDLNLEKQIKEIPICDDKFQANSKVDVDKIIPKDRKKSLITVSAQNLSGSGITCKLAIDDMLKFRDIFITKVDTKSYNGNYFFEIIPRKEDLACCYKQDNNNPDNKTYYTQEEVFHYYAVEFTREERLENLKKYCLENEFANEKVIKTCWVKLPKEKSEENNNSLRIANREGKIKTILSASFGDGDEDEHNLCIEILDAEYQFPKHENDFKDEPEIIKCKDNEKYNPTNTTETPRPIQSKDPTVDTVSDNPPSTKGGESGDTQAE